MTNTPQELTPAQVEAATKHPSDNARTITPEQIKEDLKYRLQARTKRIADLVVGCNRVPESINSADIAAQTIDFIAQCKTELTAMEKLRKEEKKPFDDAGTAVQTFFKNAVASLTAAVDKITKTVGKYHAEVAKAEAEAEAARKAAEDQAKREAEQAAIKAEQDAREAARRADSEAERAIAIAAQQKAETLRTAAEEAMTAKKQKQTPTRIIGEHGGTGYTRKPWTFEVVDPLAIPREFLEIDTKAINDAIRNGERNIPGLLIFQETTFVTRKN